jgi:microcystin-dependent protein
MSEPFLGEIRMVAFNYAPDGWAQCQGQLLPVAQNNALFSLLSTTFGGDGRVNFGLPDFQGRGPVGMGTGTNLSPIAWGAKSGGESITLTQNQMPAHNHPAQFTGQAAQVSGTASTTVNVAMGTTATDVIVQPSAGGTSYLTAATAKVGLNNAMINGLYTGTAPAGTPAKLGGVQANTSLSGLASTSSGSVAVGNTGASQPVPTRNPYLGVCFIIATQGLYPVRP